MWGYILRCSYWCGSWNAYRYAFCKYFLYFNFNCFTTNLNVLKEPLIRKLEEHGEMFPNGFGAFFVEGFFELFEVVLSFITNTMSFLRVGDSFYHMLV